MAMSLPARDALSGADYCERLDMSKFVAGFMSDESGATAIEYGLIAALVAVVLVTALGAMGTKLSGTFNNVSSSLP